MALVRTEGHRFPRGNHPAGCLCTAPRRGWQAVPGERWRGVGVVLRRQARWATAV